MKLKLDEIIKDPDIYPRVQISQKTIESYVEAIKAGAIFPAVEVQKISADGEVKTASLDGWHRLEAFKGYNKLDGVKKIEEIECKPWKDETLDKSKYLVKLMVRSFELNATQGLRPSQADAKSQLEKIAQTPDALNIVWKEIAKAFEVTPEWVSECVAPILAKSRMSRDAFIYKLKLLGWTQVEIGEVVGVSHQYVSKVASKFKEFKPLAKSDFYEKQKKIEDIAKYYHLDLPLTWAILLGGKDDLERLKLFGKSEYGDEQPKLSDYWKFSQRDPRLGIASYPGNLYGQEVLNILYRYTKQGDLVVDPMAGGGTTIDACLVMNRRCLAYDSDPQKSGRDDIRPHDIRQGFPQKAKACDLIILDPPYYKKNEGKYGGDFTKDRQTFINNIRKLAEDSYNILRPAGCVALLYGQYIDYDDEAKSILSTDLCPLFEKDNKFRPILRIQSPLTLNNQWADFDVEHAKSFTPWRILPVSKDWQIFRKV